MDCQDEQLDKEQLYKKLTDELEVANESHYQLTNIIKSNHKSIKDLREDISKWKETCHRQQDTINILRTSFIGGVISLILALSYITYLKL